MADEHKIKCQLLPWMTMDAMDLDESMESLQLLDDDDGEVLAFFFFDDCKKSLEPMI